MERISSVELDKAKALLTSPPESELSLRRLNDSEDQLLQELLGQMMERYPHQDLSSSAEGYLWDYQQLAMRYSLREVQDALAEWRLTPGRTFFPRPDEIAEFIEDRRETLRRDAAVVVAAQRQHQQIAEFWQWAPGWMAMTGNDEAELLRRFPSYKGTKPGEAETESV
jgi:hypothetical protein